MVLAWTAHEYGALPEPGGLWDQPAGLISTMRYLERVYDIFSSHNRASDRKRWDAANPGWLKVKLEIEKMRELTNG